MPLQTYWQTYLHNPIPLMNLFPGLGKSTSGHECRCRTSYKEDDTGDIIQTISQNEFSINYMFWVSMLYVAAAFT